MQTDMTIQMKSISLNKDITILFFILLFINLPYFNPAVLPAHDTMHMFSVFHYFYSDFFFNNEIAHWLHYGVYGVESSIDQLTCLQPASYFSFCIGYIFGIENVLLLFKISIFIDQLIFLTGIYLLSRMLFICRSTVYVICIGAICSTVWLIQLGFGFLIYYLVPLIFYYIIRSIIEHKPEFLWVGGILSILSLIGNYVYIAPIYLFTVSIIAFILIVKYKVSWYYIFDISFKNILFFLIFILLSIGYLYFALHLLDFVIIYHHMGSSFGGSGDINAFNIKNFLTHGDELIKTFKFPEMVSGMRIYSSPVPIYIGILPLFFFLWSVFKVRTRTFIAICSATFVLIGLSSGGILAILLYYVFPGIAFFRHLGHIYGLIKILMLICSGFGLDNFFLNIDKFCFFVKNSKIINRDFSFAKFSLVIFFYIFFIDIFISYHFHNFSTHETFDTDIVSSIIFGVRILSYLSGIILIYRAIKSSKYLNGFAIKKIKLIMIICFALDMLSFQLLSYISIPVIDSSIASSLNALKVNELTFQQQRCNSPFNIRQNNILNIIKRKFPYRNVTYYNSANSIMQLDKCFPESLDKVLFSIGMGHLIQVRRERISSDRFSFPVEDSFFLKSIGCNNPKLRLVSDIIFVDSIYDAMDILKIIDNIDNIVLLRRGEKYIDHLDVNQNYKRITVDSNDQDAFSTSSSFDDEGFMVIKMFWETTEAFPHWLQYDFGLTVNMTEYFLQAGIYSTDSTDRMPKDWELEGSNDLSIWTTVNKQTDQINWGNSEKRYFYISEPQPYRYYRLYINSVAHSDILRLSTFGIKVTTPITHKNRNGVLPEFKTNNDSDICINQFSANRLNLQVNAAQEKWLFYADSFHPGWKAYINGSSVPIMEANLAFKAVKLEKGLNNITFEFYNGLTSAISCFFAIFGTLFTIIALYFFGLIATNKYKVFSISNSGKIQ